MKNQATFFLKIVTLVFVTFLISSNSAYSQKKTLGVTQYLLGQEDDGYILYSAVGSDTTYLINKCGKKVHKWVSQYGPGLSVYLLPNGNLLRTGSYTDTGFGIAGGRGGIIEEFDWDNKLLWRYKLFNDSLCQHHDIRPLPNGNILILAWHAISKNAALALGRDSNNFANSSGQLWGERILEIKPYGLDSASIIWQWDLFDHIIQDKNATIPNYGVVNQHPELLNINYALNLRTFDWIHANGIDYNADLDQIVISCHNISEFWIIDHSTSISQAKSHTGGNCGKGGDLLYRWGNPQAYKNGTAADRKLFRQHNAQWIKNGLQDSGAIMLFNNGWERDTAYSSVDIIRTTVNSSGTYGNTIPYGPLKQSWIYKDSIPTNFYSKIISGAQRLPSGNTLICSGVQGKFFEVTPQKKKVWEYRCPINVLSQTLQSDGDAAGDNSVFRCEFYRNNYQGLSGRILTTFGTVEKNPYPFACNYDHTAPYPVTFLPQKNATEIGASPVLKITFNEGLVKKTGNIKIFQNNILIETIAITSSKVKVTNRDLLIQQSVPFTINSKIAILIPANAFTDSSFNLTNTIDTSVWYFYTEKRFTNDSFLPKHLSDKINPNTQLTLFFKENIFKALTGNINIYENSVLKEQIAISSPQISISGNIATIHPSNSFSLDASVSIEVESCFKNAIGGLNMPVTLGKWVFSTLTSPKVVTLSPANNTNNIAVNSTLSITFDRPIKISTPGFLMVYENDLLKDSIKVNGPRAMLSGNSIFFDINSAFNKSSWVSISLKQGVIVDSFGTAYQGIDTASWHFSIIKAGSGINQHSISTKSAVYPNPGNGHYFITGIDTKSTIEIMTIAGQKINFTKTIVNNNTIELAITDASAGFYLIRIDGVATYNIIKE